MPMGEGDMRRIPKHTLYEIVQEARNCGIGPSELGRSIDYSHRHLSRIALTLGAIRMVRRPMGTWSERLRDMVRAVSPVDTKVVADKIGICHHCGGVVPPKLT